MEPLEEQPHTPSGESPVEVKLKDNLIKNPQIIAQTIVFSFLQKKRHPERENFLTPCIGIGSSELVIMMYDSEHDVLLESSTIPLFENDFSCDFSYCAILVCWLTVNYRYFCSGLVQKYKMFKSSFFNIVKEKITVYEDKLQFQNVNSCPYPEFKLKNPPRSRPTFSPFLYEFQKTMFEKYQKLNLYKDSDSKNKETECQYTSEQS